MVQLQGRKRKMMIETAIRELRTTYYGDTERTKHAKQMGAEALEKQLPAKIYRDKHTLSRCPICHTMVLEAHPYCYRCGQKIDWEE